MDPSFYKDGKPVQHALELKLNAGAWAILNAMERQHMAVMNVKGQLAEYYLNSELETLRDGLLIQSFEWRLISPDFSVEWSDRTFRIECKNVRSPEKNKKNTSTWWVEVQRTRDSKDGKNTRAYRTDDFDILAVCLFNRTGEWKHRFIRSCWLARRPRDETLLEIFHEVPQQQAGHWHDNLMNTLSDEH